MGLVKRLSLCNVSGVLKPIACGRRSVVVEEVVPVDDLSGVAHQSGWSRKERMRRDSDSPHARNMRAKNIVRTQYRLQEYEYLWSIQQ